MALNREVSTAFVDWVDVFRHRATVHLVLMVFVMKQMDAVGLILSLDWNTVSSHHGFNYI